MPATTHEDRAAVKIQCAYRQRIARKVVGSKRQQRRDAFEREVEASLMTTSATSIQRKVREKQGKSRPDKQKLHPSQSFDSHQTGSESGRSSAQEIPIASSSNTLPNDSPSVSFQASTPRRSISVEVHSSDGQLPPPAAALPVGEGTKDNHPHGTESATPPQQQTPHRAPARSLSFEKDGGPPLGATSRGSSFATSNSTPTPTASLRGGISGYFGSLREAFALGSVGDFLGGTVPSDSALSISSQDGVGGGVGKSPTASQRFIARSLTSQPSSPHDLLREVAAIVIQCFFRKSLAKKLLKRLRAARDQLDTTGKYQTSRRESQAAMEGYFDHQGGGGGSAALNAASLTSFDVKAKAPTDIFESIHMTEPQAEANVANEPVVSVAPVVAPSNEPPQATSVEPTVVQADEKVETSSALNRAAERPPSQPTPPSPMGSNPTLPPLAPKKSGSRQGARAVVTVPPSPAGIPAYPSMKPGTPGSSPWSALGIGERPFTVVYKFRSKSRGIALHTIMKNAMLEAQEQFPSRAERAGAFAGLQLFHAAIQQRKESEPKSLSRFPVESWDLGPHSVSDVMESPKRNRTFYSALSPTGNSSSRWITRRPMSDPLSTLGSLPLTTDRSTYEDSRSEQHFASAVTPEPTIDTLHHGSQRLAERTRLKAYIERTELPPLKSFSVARIHRLERKGIENIVRATHEELQAVANRSRFREKLAEGLRMRHDDGGSGVVATELSAIFLKPEGSEAAHSATNSPSASPKHGKSGHKPESNTTLLPIIHRNPLGLTALQKKNEQQVVSYLRAQQEEMDKGKAQAAADAAANKSKIVKVGRRKVVLKPFVDSNKKVPYSAAEQEELKEKYLKNILQHYSDQTRRGRGGAPMGGVRLRPL
jgi:hypothetical protein